MRRHPKTKDWFPALKIREKLLLLSILVLVLTLLFLSVVYIYWSDFVRKEYLENQKMVFQQTEQMVQDNIARRQIVVRTLCESSIVADFLMERDYDVGEEMYNNNVEPVLNVLTETASNGQLIWLIRYHNEGFERVPNNYEGLQDGVTTNSLEIENGLHDFAVINQLRVSQDYWFRSLRGNLNAYRVQQINMDYLNNCFSLVEEIRSNGIPVGMLRLISPIADLIGTEPDEMPQQGNISFVLDEQFYLLSITNWKKVFMVDNADLFNDAIEELRKGNGYQDVGKDWIITAAPIEESELYLIQCISSKSINDKTHQLQSIMLFTFAALFLVTVVFVFSTSNYLSGRILHLLHAMKQFEGGKLYSSVTVSGKDEISTLYDGFNQMTEQIRHLLQHNVEIATEKEKTELQLLLMQINPHFLYNSLSTISRLAEQGENAIIKRMVMALTTFYRLSLNKGQTSYTVYDEKQQIEAYLNIFHVRKGDLFSCVIDFDESSYEHIMPKLILQPFVENIFQHAFSEHHTFINISITQRCKDEWLVFRICDDGCGIPCDIKESLFNVPSHHSGGFGIYNVNARLALLYGSNYCIEIQSSTEGGTQIDIRIPKGNVQKEELC